MKQDTQVPSVANGALSKETFYSGVIENMPIINGYSGLLQLLKGSADPHLSAFSEHLNSSDGDISWVKTVKNGGRPNEDFLLQPTLPERKRTRNIGSKSKRLHIDAEDALELKLTWEEAQDLLRPPPSVKPSIVMIEDQEFEEYEVSNIPFFLSLINILKVHVCFMSCIFWIIPPSSRHTGLLVHVRKYAMSVELLAQVHEL